MPRQFSDLDVQRIAETLQDALNGYVYDFDDTLDIIVGEYDLPLDVAHNLAETYGAGGMDALAVVLRNF